MVWTVYHIRPEDREEEKPHSHGRSHMTSDRNVWAHAGLFALVLLAAYIAWGMFLQSAGL
jgi:type VI protein secretion system component VasF